MYIVSNLGQIGSGFAFNAAIQFSNADIEKTRDVLLRKFDLHDERSTQELHEFVEAVAYARKATEASGFSFRGDQSPKLVLAFGVILTCIGKYGS